MTSQILHRWSALIATTLLAAPVLAGPPGIVLMIGDDHGQGDLGCYGHPVIKTPNLDQLAATGVRFTNAFASCASCSPSRSVLLTGLHTHTSGQYGLAHPPHSFSTRPNVRSVFLRLRDAGFRTGLVGKKHVEPEQVYPIDFAPKVNGRDGRQLAKRSAEFLDSCKDRPFFLVVGFTDSHRAFDAGKELAGSAWVEYDPASMIVPAYLPDHPDVRRDLADYASSVTQLDTNVGLIMEALRDSGREEETLVLYVSDNGMPFPGAKTNVYDSALRLPFIARVPGSKANGTVSDSLVSFVDVTPTILDWAGLAEVRERKLPGRSFLKTLQGKEDPGPDHVFGSHTFHEVTMYYPMRMIRTRRYKLITNLAAPLPFPFASDLYASPTWQVLVAHPEVGMGCRSVEQFLRRPPVELYDLEADPNESKNRADDPALADIRRQLESELWEFRKQTADPWIERDEQKLPPLSRSP